MYRYEYMNIFHLLEIDATYYTMRSSHGLFVGCLFVILILYNFVKEQIDDLLTNEVFIIFIIIYKLINILYILILK